MAQYLDYKRLQKFWGKIKGIITGIQSDVSSLTQKVGEIYDIKDITIPLLTQDLNYVLEMAGYAALTSLMAYGKFDNHVVPFLCEELPILYNRIQTLELLVEYLKLNNNTTNTSWFSINLPNNQVWLSGYYPELGCMELPLYDFGNVYIIQAEEYKTPSVFTFDGNVTSVEDVLSDDGIPKVWVPGSVKNVAINPDNGVGLVKNLVYFEEGVEYVGTRYPILVVDNLYLPSSLKEINFDTGGSIRNLFYNGTRELFGNICNEIPVIENMLYCNDYFYSNAYSGTTIWKPEEIPANEIWYKTYDNSMFELDFLVGSSDRDALGADIINHIYENGKGVIVCDGPVNVNINVFSGDPALKLTWLGIPKCLDVGMDFYFYYLQFLVIKECPACISGWLKLSQLCFVDIFSTIIGLSYNSYPLFNGLILRNNSEVIHLELPDIGLSAFNVFVPKELVNLYKQDTNWCVHNIYAIPDQYYIK